jgi:hypothetical protein
MCVWLPRRTWKKLVAVTLLVITIFAPRLLQLLHPAGNFHSLTLTAYAVTIAGFVTILARGGNILTRNLSMLSAVVLIAGYLIQANWISTVNYLNTLAHYTTLTQILSRVRAIPTDQWDGKQVVVIGRYEMPKGYPFRSATGVASGYISEQHLQRLARLMRDELVVLPLEAVPKARGYASSHLPWPHPGSVGVVDGVGVVILSNEQLGKPAAGTHDPGEEVTPK